MKKSTFNKLKKYAEENGGTIYNLNDYILIKFRNKPNFETIPELYDCTITTVQEGHFLKVY